MPQLDQWGTPDITDYRYEKQYGEEEHVNKAGEEYCEEYPVLVAVDRVHLIATDAHTSVSVTIDD